MGIYKFKTINIKGKEYVEVNERIKFFRTDNQYKGWSMYSDIVSHENGKILFKTTIRDLYGNIRAVGHAQEKEGDGFINKTSYTENCESSSIGRALGCLGIGIDTSIATYEEVQNAINNQNVDNTEIKSAKKVFSKEETKGDTDILVDNITKTIRSKKTVEEMKGYAKELSSKREILSKEQATHINSVYMQKLKEIKGA